LLVGLIAGAILATTPQGRKVMDDAKKKATDMWSSPDVQKTVNDVQRQVRENVPVVGETIADGIEKTKPAS
jgi:hypothetical protein